MKYSLYIFNSNSGFVLIQRTHDMLKLNFCFQNLPPVVLLLTVGEVSGLYAFLYLKSSQLLRITVALLRPVKAFQFDLQIYLMWSLP